MTAARRQPQIRQQVLVLYLATSALDAPVVGWSRYDGTGRDRPRPRVTATNRRTRPASTPSRTAGGSSRPPSCFPPHPGHEYDVSFLKHEFFFEKLDGDLGTRAAV